MGVSPSALRRIFREVLREELTTGDKTLRKLLTELLFGLSIKADEVGLAKETTLSSIDGKTPSLTAAGNRPIAVSEDVVGLAKEATVATHMKTISANDYEKLDIDLGVARTNAVIASSVHGFRILRRTAGAVFELKMIDATKSPLTQDDIANGGGLVDFEPTNLLLTNPAQAGYTLTIVVFKRV